MADDIFIIQDDGTLIEMGEKDYDSEALLQQLLASYPKLLAGGQIDTASPRRWLLIKREMGIPGEEEGGGRWSLDHLFLDQDAIPTLVEVKRSRDTRIRREVVGQMLDYAANAVVYWPGDNIPTTYKETCQADGVDPDNRLLEFLGEEADPEEFWQKVKTNLQAGKIRMLFVADVIPPELRRIVEFLNEQMDPAEVLAVEIKQYVGEGMKTLVPRVIGQTAEADTKKRVRRNRSLAVVSDEDAFFSDLRAAVSPSEVEAAKQIVAWMKQHFHSVEFWRGARRDGVIGQALPNIDGCPFILKRSGQLVLSFRQFLKATPPFDRPERRHELLQRLNRIAGVQLPDESVEHYPLLPLATIAGRESLQQFLDAFKWCLDEIKGALE